ncbi:uncharacterized protein [Aegilops tauschii subsp. strangulata]|uniref:uncharacterized protein n=1 Tax=Aegilops tauschii subsp. strangulata TaxID=200361 RepID=UPI003CC8835A
MLSQLDFKIFGLETIKDQYVHDAEFKDVLQNCKEGRTWNKFVVNDGFVFRANKLCIPASSVRFVVVAGGAWRRTNGTLWREEDGGYTCYTFLLAKDETGC